MILNVTLTRSATSVPMTIYHTQIRSGNFPITCLSASEKHTYAAFNNVDRQTQFLAGRWALKQTLATQLNLPVDHIQIQSGTFGNPLMVPVGAQIAECSLSHSATAVIAVASPYGHPVTVDIESTNRNKKGILSKLTGHEQKLLNSAHHLEHPEVAFWSIKEACSKIIKCGLYANWQILEIGSITRTSDHIYDVLFSNLFQYKAITFQFPDHYISLVLPKNTEIPSDNLYSKLSESGALTHAG